MFYILALAAVLRLIFINQSLWLDESIEALALQGHFGPLLSYSLSDFQPPLYHFILKTWTSISGFSELSLRLPSLISGLFTVYFVVKIGELLGNKSAQGRPALGGKIGLVAGLLAATNPLLIYYSQEGRTYSMTTFFVTASFYYFIKLLQSKNRELPSTIYYLLTTTAFLWTSYLAWLVLLAQGIYVIYKKRSDLMAIQVVAVSTLIFWLPSFIRSLQIGMTDAQLVPGWGRVVGGISPKSLALTWIKTNIGRISFENNYLYGGIVSLLAILHFSILRHVRSIILFIWLVIPVVLAGTISLFVPVYSYTRVLFVAPAYLLLLATGLSKLHYNFTYLAVTAQIIFMMFFWFSPRFHREDWRSLTQYLNSQDGVVVMPSLKQDAPFLYYHLTLPLHSSTDSSLNNPRVYYVKYVEEAFDPAGLGPANLALLGYTMTSQKTYSGLQLDIYENRH